MSGDRFIEWAVQYEQGVQIVDDEEQARDWQQYLPQPNRVVCRTITRSEWAPPAASSVGSEQPGGTEP